MSMSTSPRRIRRRTGTEALAARAQRPDIQARAATFAALLGRQLDAGREALRRGRLAAHLTQEQAANDFADITPEGGYGWGMRSGSWSRLENLSQHFANMRVAMLLTALEVVHLRPTEWAQSVEAAMGLSAPRHDELRLLQAYRRIADEGRREEAVLLIEMLAQSQSRRPPRQGVAPRPLLAQEQAAAVEETAGVLDAIDTWHDGTSQEQHAGGADPTPRPSERHA